MSPMEATVRRSVRVSEVWLYPTPAFAGASLAQPPLTKGRKRKSMNIFNPRIFAYPTNEPWGYTLTELMIVLGILAVVLGLSGTWLASQLPQYRLNGVVRQIRADLLAARAQAVRQGNEVRIFFTDPEHYDILDDDNNNGRADPGEAVESRSIQEEFAGVAIQSNNNPIFHPRGTASSLATVTVSNASGEKAITISITGRVKVKKPRDKP